MNPDSLLSKIVAPFVALVFGILGFLFQRTLRKIDKDNEDQKTGLASLGEKIDRSSSSVTEQIQRFERAVTDQVRHVEREVHGLRVEMTRDVATLRSEIGTIRDRQTHLEKDLNQAMRWVRTEFEVVHKEIAAADEVDA